MRVGCTRDGKAIRHRVALYESWRFSPMKFPPFAANRPRVPFDTTIAINSFPDSTSGPRPEGSNCAFLARRSLIAKSSLSKTDYSTGLLRRAKGVGVLALKNSLYSAKRKRPIYHGMYADRLASCFHDGSQSAMNREEIVFGSYLTVPRNGRFRGRPWRARNRDRKRKKEP